LRHLAVEHVPRLRDTEAKALVHAEADADPDREADPDANPDSEADPDREADADPDRETDPNPDREADADPDRETDPDPDGEADADPDGEADRHAHPNPETHAHSNTDSHPDGGPATGGLGDPVADRVAVRRRTGNSAADGHAAPVSVHPRSATQQSDHRRLQQRHRGGANPGERGPDPRRSDHRARPGGVPFRRPAHRAATPAQAPVSDSVQVRSDLPPVGHRVPVSGIRRRRTLTLLVALGLTPLIAVAILATAIAGSAITQQINNRLTGVTQQASAYLEQLISGRADALSSIAADPISVAAVEQAPTADPAATSALLAALANAEVNSQGIALYNAAGVQVAGTGEVSAVAGLPADWRTRLAHGGFVVAAASTPVSPAVTVAVPVLASGTAVGFLAENYDLSAAASSLDTFATAQGMSLMILDAQGRLVLGVQVSASGYVTPMKKWTPDPSVTRSVDAAATSHRIGIDDSSRGEVATYGALNNVPWVTRAALPGSAMAPVTDMEVAIFSVAAALALLFVAAVNLVNQALKRQEETELALVEQSAALEDVAMHDPLTSLPNRLLFNDRLLQSISNARRKSHRVSLFVLDLDGFKSLNDRLGHEAGDILLKETANRLQASVRASDTVARIGGDEFVILAVDAEMADAELIRAKIRQRMSEPVLIDGNPVSLRLSIGVAVFPDDGTESAHLLRRADSNMYFDKRTVKAVSLLGVASGEADRTDAAALPSTAATEEEEGGRAHPSPAGDPPD